MSLDRQISKVDLVCSPALEAAKWAATVEGRILIIQVSSLELSHPWGFGGVYQHVAKQDNSEEQDMVLCTLHHVQHIAREKVSRGEK